MEKLSKNIFFKNLFIIFQSIILIFSFRNYTKAESITLSSDHTVNARFAYNGMEVITTFVTDPDGMPAYCVNKELHGITVGESYDVELSDLVLQNENIVNLWKVIVNGYPYVSNSELGVWSDEEAFASTKQAVYCVLNGNDPNGYTGIDEAGYRIANAIRTIVSRANAETRSIYDAICNLQEVEVTGYDKIYDDWYLNPEKNLIFKKYVLDDNKLVSNLSVSVDNNVFEIYDENFNFVGNNCGQKTFIVGFEIKNLTSEGNFEINVTGNFETNAMFYGCSNNETTQDYIVTQIPVQPINQYYMGNISTGTLQIKKVDEEGNPMQNVMFLLIPEEQMLTPYTIMTDENGMIDKLMPVGNYTLQEVKTLDGYVLDNTVYNVTIDLNKTTTMMMINYKEKEEEPEPTEEPVPEKVEEPVVETVVVKKLPKTGF